jgi:hypothetical protein
MLLMVLLLGCGFVVEPEGQTVCRTCPAAPTARHSQNLGFSASETIVDPLHLVIGDNARPGTMSGLDSADALSEGFNVPLDGQLSRPTVAAGSGLRGRPTAILLAGNIYLIPREIFVACWKYNAHAAPSERFSRFSIRRVRCSMITSSLTFNPIS